MRYWKSNNPWDLFYAPIALCAFLLFPPDMCACTTIIVGKAASGVLWLCMGTPCCGVYIPYYMGHNRFPAPFCRAKAAREPDSAYWVFSDLADAAEGFQPGGRLFVRNHWESFERHAEMLREAVEAKARSLHEKSPEAARDFLTWYSNALAHQAMSDARELRSAAQGKQGE